VGDDHGLVYHVVFINSHKSVRFGALNGAKKMSLLTIHTENRPDRAEIVREHGAIAERLEEIGVRFERWTAGREFGSDAAEEVILGAYREPVERLKKRYGFESADVISVRPDHPQKDELRAKFLDEHVHSDFEVRFFVEGRGLFFLHPSEHVYAVLCEQGDLISVPAHVKHWFDMGDRPNLKCIRLFTTPEGWVAEFTGSDIAGKFPKLEQFLREYA
jgi:1,2-dihydroxy-3-keto-5-methylthiopentene dioxygenase